MRDEEPEWMKILADILTENETSVKQPTDEELEKMPMSEMVELAKQTAIQELKQEGVNVRKGPNECCKRYHREQMALIGDIISNPRFWDIVDEAKRKRK